MNPNDYLVLSAILFAIGIVGPRARWRHRRAVGPGRNQLLPEPADAAGNERQRHGPVA